MRELGEVAGIKGLIAGQMEDIDAEGKKTDKKTLNFIHNNKTAKLINIALRFGALAGRAPEKDLKIIEDYGSKIGLVFQIVDDLLDVEGTQHSLGKTIGKDEAAGKATFPSQYGVEESRAMAQKLTREAIKGIAALGERSIRFRILADHLLNRKS